jgi:hypothetical protein
MDSGDRLLSNLLYLQEHEKVEHYGEIGHQSHFTRRKLIN